MISLHNFLATIFQCMPMPTLARIESEATQIRRLQEENQALRERIEHFQSVAGSPSGQSSSSTSSHQSRLSTFNEPSGSRDRSSVFYTKAVGGASGGSSTSSSLAHALDDIIPYPIAASRHIVDDFSTIAQESLNIGNVADTQLRGLKLLIRNIGGGHSPTMGRKDASMDRNKTKRSGSAGPRSPRWLAKD